MKPTSSSNPGKPTFSHQLADEEKTMPLGVGDGTGEEQILDPLAGAGQSRSFRSGSLLIVVVVVIAGAGLWFMRSLSHVAGASAKSDMELTIEKFLGARDPKATKNAAKGTDPGVLAVLSESYTKRQVPLDSVKQNPFILPGEGEAPTIAPVAGESPDEAMARARTLRQKDIDAAVSKLAVKSIIMGSQPLANISGTIVRVGDELAPEGTDVTFRVGAIAADGITLVAEDLALGMHVEVPLSMHQNK